MRIATGWMPAAALLLAMAGSAGAQGAGTSTELPCNAFCRSYLGLPEPLSSAPRPPAARAGDTVVEATAPDDDVRAGARVPATSSKAATAAKPKLAPRPTRTRFAARGVLPPDRPADLRAAAPLPPEDTSPAALRTVGLDLLSAALPPIDEAPLPSGFNEQPASARAISSGQTVQSAEPLTRWAGTRRPRRR